MCLAIDDDVKGGLEARLVQTRKGLAGVDRLQVSGSVPAEKKSPCSLTYERTYKEYEDLLKNKNLEILELFQVYLVL